MLSVEESPTNGAVAEPDGAPNKPEAVRILKSKEQNDRIKQENSTKWKQNKQRILIFGKSVKGSVPFFHSEAILS